MQYINRLSDYVDSRESAVTFGKFDGLHKGHQKLIEKVRELSAGEELAVGTYRKDTANADDAGGKAEISGREGRDAGELSL